jgi:hypothetical protein
MIRQASRHPVREVPMIPSDATAPTRRAAVAVLLAAVATPTAGRAQAGAGGSGSLAYDRMDLSSAEAALRTFLSAYRDGDYVGAFWVLAPEAQDEVARHVAQLNLGRLARLPAQGRMTIMTEMIPPTAEVDQRDYGFMFATIMQVAKRRGILPLNVAGMPDDLPAASLGRQTETNDGFTEIAVTLSAYPAPVVFRFFKARSGRWRLRQIVPPGGDATSLPFGL